MDAPPETSASTKVKTAKPLKINIRSALAKASPKKKKSKCNDQPNCAFLQLPGELRNQIYDLVLVRDKNEDNSTESERIELRTLKRPALTATCRQIQSESLSYFFRHESFKYTFILDGHAKLSYKVNSKTLKWLKVANIKDLTIYDLTFGAQLPDVDGPYDSKDMPLRSEKVDLIKVKGTQLDIIEHARDDDESVESAKTLKRREKLLKEMEILATTGVDLKSAQKIANLILRVGGFRFRLMLLYIRGLCLVRDRVSRRLADILALAPVV